MQLHYREIAQDLTSRLSAGHLLDVGTGPGRLLQAIHSLNPAIDLYDLDISFHDLAGTKESLWGGCQFATR
jgi:2-polyprenyl-3-methyl-5-hydroxy-6-metoxy-1,4-benzoquinol methylase